MPVTLPPQRNSTNRYLVICQRMRHSLPAYAPGHGPAITCLGQRRAIIFIAGEFDTEEATNFVIDVFDDTRGTPPETALYFRGGPDVFTVGWSAVDDCPVDQLRYIEDNFSAMELTDCYTYHLILHFVTKCIDLRAVI